MQDPILLEVSGDLLTLFERFETAHPTNIRSNKTSIKSVNTLLVDVNKLIDEKSWIPTAQGKVRTLSHHQPQLKSRHLKSYDTVLV